MNRKLEKHKRRNAYETVRAIYYITGDKELHLISFPGNYEQCLSKLGELGIKWNESAQCFVLEIDALFFFEQSNVKPYLLVNRILSDVLKSHPIDDVINFPTQNNGDNFTNEY